AVEIIAARGHARSAPQTCVQDVQQHVFAGTIHVGAELVLKRAREHGAQPPREDHTPWCEHRARYGIGNVSAVPVLQHTDGASREAVRRRHGPECREEIRQEIPRLLAIAALSASRDVFLDVRDGLRRDWSWPFETCEQIQNAELFAVSPVVWIPPTGCRLVV